MKTERGPACRQAGFTPAVLVILAALGIVIYLLLSSTLPFKDKLFSLLYPKPSSLAQEEDWKGYEELVQKGKIKQAEQVITVHLSYNVQNTPQLIIKNARKRRGYASFYPASDNGYMLQLLDNQKKVLYSFNFEIPNKIASDTITSNNHFEGKIETAKIEELFFTLPDYSNATEIKLLDPNKKLIHTKDLKGIPVEENRPNFNSITGDTFLKRNSSNKLLNLKRLLAKDSYAASTDNSYVDMTFIGDSYTDINVFHNDVNRLINHLLTYEPYKSQSSRIRFNYVDNTSSLGCNFTAGTNSLDCNTDLVYQKVAESGVPYDNLYIIVNRSTMGGRALLDGKIAYGYNGDYGPQAFAHESAHSFGALLDEYNNYPSEGIIDNKTHANCYSGAPPAADWQDSVAVSDYRQGCSYPNWYASSQSSIMRTVYSAYYNNISKIYLNQKINTYASEAPVPKPTPAPNCNCTYGESCTDSNGLPGTRICNGVINGSDTCVWDSSGVCAANCTSCQSVSTPPPSCSCSYSQSCTTSSNQIGLQSCYGISGSSGSCVWDNSGACNPSCTTCQTTSGVPLPTPPPSCDWCTNSSYCASSGGTFYPDPDPSTGGWCSVENDGLCCAKTPLPTGGTGGCVNCKEMCSWGLRQDWIQSNGNCNSPPQPLEPTCWVEGPFSADPSYCSAPPPGNTSLYIDPNPVNQGGTLTVVATGTPSCSTDINNPPNSGGGYSNCSVTGGFTCSGGNPKDANSCWWQWSCTAGSANSYTASFTANYNGSGDYTTCKSTRSYSVQAPTPTPIAAPISPKITKNVSCVNGPYKGSEVTISWTNPTGAPVSWADISPNLYFSSLWNKNVSGLTSTNAPTGFSDTPSLLPDLPYYVRLYNGVHSPTASFAILSCPTPTPTPSPADTQAPSTPTNLTANPVSSSQINLSWNPSTDNIGVTGYDVFRNSTKVATVVTTSYGDTGLAPSTTYTYFVKAFDKAGNISPSSNTVSTTTKPPTQIYSITGTVYSSAGGVLSGVRVTIKVGGSNKSYLTDSKGVFNMTNIPPGTYSLTFKKSGYITQTASVNVTSGATTTIVIILSKR